jgi:hypothetical protein
LFKLLVYYQLNAYMEYIESFIEPCLVETLMGVINKLGEGSWCVSHVWVMAVISIQDDTK